MMWTRVKPAGAGSLGVDGAAESGFGVSALGDVAEVVGVVEVVALVAADALSGAS
jgi:hypothetical protein